MNVSQGKGKVVDSNSLLPANTRKARKRRRYKMD
jgi:hypothetical protein